MRPGLLSAIVILAIGCSAALSVTPARAGIPVVDVPARLEFVAEAALDAARFADEIFKLQTQIENQLEQYGLQEDEFGVQQNQYAKQKQEFDLQEDQFDLQEDQYTLEVRNTEAPDHFIWDEADATVDQLIESIDTLGHYQNTLGSVDAYLSQFRDLSYYKSSPCFSEEGCSDNQMSAMVENEELSSESQKKANDALFKGLAIQQANLEADAQKLVQLQDAAQGATGRLAVLQYANQFASQQVTQLMQIRGLLMAQQNALASEMQAQANQRAQEQASSARLRKGSFEASPVRTW